jgi:hypothetical protein
MASKSTKTKKPIREGAGSVNRRTSRTASTVKAESQHLEAPVDPGHRGCLSCPAPQRMLAMDRRIAVGFGAAYLTRDGLEVFSESYGMDYEDCWSVQQAEDAAREHPESDWRIVLHGPMHGETYQRHGDGQWVCIESNNGFA